ncbi:ABC transporter permease [Neglectibacter caecimuris]|uniref:ABC transporter permease n=1 Tax=Neglectibacter caecimuris TaxID=3093658 RepID=UPI002AC8D8AF|nr:ABC transporter permease subunit [Neglectibacter sp. M00184]
MKAAGTKKSRKHYGLREQMALQSMIFPAILVLFVFSYVPMYGIVIAFKDFRITDGIFGSPWVGLKYFQQFLVDPSLWKVLRNTMVLNVVGTLICFPTPIILAVLISELKNKSFKKVAQTVSYLPYFLSWVIFAGLIMEMLRPSGIFSDICVALGISKDPINFMAHGSWFYAIYILSSLIKGLGYGSIIYVAALSGVDQEIYEAATVDGCSRLQRIWYVSLPSIMGTVVIMLILQIGSILNTGVEQILIFQNPLNLNFSETLDTYVYKIGISQGRMSYSTAVNLLKSLVSVVLLCIANGTSRKLTEKSLF